MKRNKFTHLHPVLALIVGILVGTVVGLIVAALGAPVYIFALVSMFVGGLVTVCVIDPLW